jgi:hypothetical protein
MSSDNLVDIKTVDIDKNMSREENAKFFLEKIVDHKNFKVGNNVVKITFADTDKTLSQALANYFSKV